MTADEGIRIVDVTEGPLLPIVEGDGSARAVIWPGMGAELRSVIRLSLGAGARTVTLAHPSDAVYYVVAGEGEVREPAGEASSLLPGSMFHVDAGTEYVVHAIDKPMELVGGPSPADPALYQGEA